MRRRRWERIAGAMVVTTAIGSSLTGAAAARATFAPQPGPAFNNPEGDVTQQYAIMQRIENNIDTAPKGSVIRIAVYSITLNDFADKLIAAHQRGVYVKLLIDQHSRNAIWDRLVAELGSRVDTKSASSYAALCYGGCVAHYYRDGTPAAWLHTKFYLFSGGGTRTVTLSSANPTRAQAEVAWNNSYTVVGNDDLYNAYVKNFADLSKGTTGTHTSDYYWTFGSNPKAYYWPKATGKSDTILSMLKLVTCSSAYPSQIRVAIFEWTDNRLAIAKQLAGMASKGCRVTVLYTKSQIGPSVQSVLADSKVDVRDTTHGTDESGYAAHYTHDKYLLIDGRYDGVSGRRIVMTGSANYTANGLYHNDESDMKVTSTTVYQAYLTDFNHQIAAIPAVAAKQRALGERPEIPVDPRQAEDS